MREISLLSVAALLAAHPVAAQQPPAAPVRVTPAASFTFQAEVRLPARVESRVTSLVATEVEGLVVEYNAREGQEIKQGDVLAKLRTRQLELEIQAIEAQIQEQNSRRKLAEREYNRAQELFDAKVIPEEELDVKQYELETFDGREASLRAQIERLEDQIEQSVVRAPFDGVILAESSEQGEWLGKGGAVAELMSRKNLQVHVDVPERYLTRFRQGSAVSISFDALGGRRVAGTVRAVIPQADLDSRTFPVKLEIPEVAGALPGMLAEAVFPGGERGARTIVPKDAIVLRGSAQLVYIVTSEGAAQPVPVRPGAAVGQWIAVEGPISPGDSVVVRGNERLQPGQPVSAQTLEYPLP